MGGAGIIGSCQHRRIPRGARSFVSILTHLGQNSTPEHVEEHFGRNSNPSLFCQLLFAFFLLF